MIYAVLTILLIVIVAFLIYVVFILMLDGYDAIHADDPLMAIGAVIICILLSALIVIFIALLINLITGGLPVEALPR